MKSISIIVSAYNISRFIEKCLKSVLLQEFNDYELIIIDDGSIDSTSLICDEFIRVNINIKVVHKQNNGLTSTRIVGNDLSNAKYISFIDGDDFLEKDMYKKMYESAEKQSAEITMCNYYITSEDGYNRKVSLPMKKLIYKEEIIKSYVLPIIGNINEEIKIPGFLWARLYLSEIVSKNVFVSERDYFSEDDIFNIEIVKDVNRIAFVDSQLYHYVQHNSSLTYKYRRNMWNMIQKRYTYFKKYLKSIDLSNDDFQHLYFNGLSGLLNSVDNIVKGCNIFTATKMFDEIRNSSLFTEINEMINRKLFSTSDKLWFFCLKNRIWILLYLYRKWRLCVWRP